MYKAVFIDVDGTLIRDDHSVSPATFDVIQKLKEKNILVVLISARPLSGIMPIAEKVNLAEGPIASLNGAYIVDCGKIIFNSIIDGNSCSNAHAQLLKYMRTVIYYQQELWYAESQDYNTNHEQKITSIPLIIQPFDNTLQFWRDKNTGPNKILFIAEESLVSIVQDKLVQKFNSCLNIYTSKPTYLEIMNRQASKTNAVQMIMDHYNISRKETIAIGDNFNDKEMIEFVGTGIAMGNAPDEVKAAANYVTDTNNNDGVARAIIKFIELF